MVADLCYPVARHDSSRDTAKTSTKSDKSATLIDSVSSYLKFILICPLSLCCWMMLSFQMWVFFSGQTLHDLTVLPLHMKVRLPAGCAMVRSMYPNEERV